MGMTAHDADDILQKVVLSLWKRLPERGSTEFSRFRSYIARTTQNCVLDFIRSRKSELQRMEKIQADEELGYLNSIQLPEIDAIAQREWELYLTNLAFDIVKKHFTGNAVAVFEMFLAGKDKNEVADALGIEVNTAYRLRSRVENRLLQEVERLRTEFGE
jgi:RNA polymerase sigma-70 factor (ECF subfamily)